MFETRTARGQEQQRTLWGFLLSRPKKKVPTGGQTFSYVACRLSAFPKRTEFFQVRHTHHKKGKKNSLMN